MAVGDVINLYEEPPLPEAAALLPHKWALKWLVVPLYAEGDRMFCACAAPTVPILQDLYLLTGLFAEPKIAPEEDIRVFLNRLYSDDYISTIESQFLVEENIKLYQTAPEFAALSNSISSAPAVQLVDSLIESAFLNRASDIHIEPLEHSLQTRFRIDGHLTEPNHVSISLLNNVVSRLKIMAGVNITEKRIPQDGAFSLKIRGEAVDFRIATMPTGHGEKAAVRLQYTRDNRLGLADIFFAEDLPAIKWMLAKPHGALIITGPTGSGKSTTLTAFMSELNHFSRNIVTVEDPIENPIDGINHTAVAPEIGLDFPRALRHVLRQDPDIIMLGEIRDEETARAATRAAITGHLLLSTLHTNDAAGVFARLVNMGVEPYLVASSLNGIIAQRLVRRLCACAIPAAVSARVREQLLLPADVLPLAPNGCNQCGNLGYKGRFAIYEYIEIDDAQRESMHNGELMPKQTNTLFECAARNIIMGRTSVAEVIQALIGEEK